MTAKPINLSDLPRDLIEANRDNLAAQGFDDRSPGIPLDPKRPLLGDIKLEKELQQQCESWLTLHGYYRMTADEAMRIYECRPLSAANMRGWFGHWTRNQRNPLWPDLYIMSYPVRRQPLLVELKVCDKYRPGQREMIELGLWVECRRLEYFIEIATDWEAGE